MKRQWILFTTALLFTGCTQFTFQPDATPPQTEHDKLVQAQQRALEQQQQTTLDNYRL